MVTFCGKVQHMRRCRRLGTTMVRMVLELFAAGLVAGMLAISQPVRADTENAGPRYSSVPISADGIGKR